MKPIAALFSSRKFLIFLSIALPSVAAAITGQVTPREALAAIVVVGASVIGGIAREDAALKSAKGGDA